MKRILAPLLVACAMLCQSLVAFAQNQPSADNINTFVVDVDPRAKTKLVFTIHESDLSLSAKNLTELLNSLPRAAEINLVLGTQENENEITRRLHKGIQDADKRGVRVNVMPFDVNIAEGAIRSDIAAPIAQIEMVEELSTRELNERNTIVTTRATLGSVARDFKNMQWKGLITATLITGAGAQYGASVIGPSWVLAADSPISYQITSAFVSTVLLYWMPRKSESIHNFYKLSYEYIRSGRYIIPSLISKDFSLPNPSPKGQMITTAVFGGILAPVAINTLTHGLALGFDALSYPEFQSVLLRNSLMIGAASTPWSVFAYNLRTKTNMTDVWATTIRTATILGIGFAAMNGTGVTEHYLYGYSLNWSEYMLLATGTLGILANKYGIPFLNKVEHTLWFQYLNRNMEYLVNLPENALRLLRGKAPTHTYWNTRKIKRSLRCVKFLSMSAQ
ncbi:MAG: hypothetical protein M9899_04830 [Bdellovibrionaceae bacterium]|nr:hypothetical protein [Pseudobdellovibrionaceae bacterium]